MNDPEPRSDAAKSGDLSRHAATTGDTDYCLSIEDALACYEEAGIPRTVRSIQRYCAKGHLSAHRMETPFGEKFLITPQSVDRHIAYIKEVRLVATSRDVSRHAATDVAGKNKDEGQRQGAATSTDEPRQPTTDDRYVARLESENEFLREQITVKDKQIADQQERARETNLLINGLQRLLAPLLSAPDRGDTRSRDFFSEGSE